MAKDAVRLARIDENLDLVYAAPENTSRQTRALASSEFGIHDLKASEYELLRRHGPMACAVPNASC